MSVVIDEGVPYKSHLIIYRIANERPPNSMHIIHTMNTKRAEAVCGHRLPLPGHCIGNVMTFEEIKREYRPGVDICKDCIRGME